MCQGNSMGWYGQAVWQVVPSELVNRKYYSYNNKLLVDGVGAASGKVSGWEPLTWSTGRPDAGELIRRKIQSGALESESA